MASRPRPIRLGSLTLKNAPKNLAIRGTEVQSIHDVLRALAQREVLVGFPEENAERKDEDGKPTPITNAALGYVHDTGMPEQNIPARPFMLPGMQNALPACIVQLQKTAQRAFTHRNYLMVEQGLMRVGLTAQAGIRNKINEGVPPPLSEYTLRDRARRGRMGAKQELEARRLGLSPSVTFAKPLIDTGQLRNAITFVIRDRKKRK